MKALVSVAVLLSAGVVYAVDPPEMKEGLWSMHKQTISNPGNKKMENTTTLCRNHAYDQHVHDLAKNMKGCTTATKLEGGKYYSESHCVISAMTVESKGTTTYDGDQAAHSEVHSTYSPALAGVSELTLRIDQKYLGACPAGMSPGDVKTADGHITHLWKQ